MPHAKQGYRVDRLRRRRSGATRRVQSWVLYLLAAVVSFCAVLGAWYVAGDWLGSSPPARPAGYLTLLTLTAPDSGTPAAAALVVKDPLSGTSALYVVPRDLLLEGPNGEYVFAEDAMTAGTLRADLERVIKAPIDAVYRLPVRALGELAGADTLLLTLTDPASVQVNGAERSFEDGSAVTTAELPALLAAEGATGYDASRLQEALWSAVLEAAALRPEQALATARTAAAARATGDADTWYLDGALEGLTSGDAPVARFPSDSRVAEGQFAFLPNGDQVMAQLTRKAPSYASKYTVRVQNGTGQVGVGRAVADRLAVLDVNLPPVVNADTFDYRQTRILAGEDALPVAQEVRAILGRGVVLDGADLPADTVVVIVGADIKLTQPTAKDQQ
jgi:hypothetical protein